MRERRLWEQWYAGAVAVHGSRGRMQEWRRGQHLPPAGPPHHGAESAHTKRQRGDSNPCGQSPMDFESISLTARTHCLCRTETVVPSREKQTQFAKVAKTKIVGRVADPAGQRWRHSGGRARTSLPLCPHWPRLWAGAALLPQASAAPVHS